MTVTAAPAWSRYQLALYDFVESGNGSAIVEAVAGSGKTTSLVECARRLSEWDNACAVAFNVRIKDELLKRLPAAVPALTLNALSYRAWRAFTGKQQEVDKGKIAALVRELSDDTNPDFRQGVRRLVDLAKMAGVVPSYVKTATQPLAEDEPETWRGLIDEYGIGFGWGDKDDRAIELARRVLAESVRVGAERIDFNDQLYLPVVFGADFQQYDWLFVDEAQDLNEIQRVMIERSASKSCRLLAFGDPAQAIYGWRGAGRNALPLLRERFNAVSLPLSICYRCSKAVVRKAQQFQPAIEWAEDAPEGLVDENATWMPETFLTTDVILCRNNAPLVKMAFRLLRAGKACKVMGRDIGNGLVALVQRLRATTITELQEKLAKWLAQEVRAVGEEKPEQTMALYDRAETLRVFMENARTPAEVKEKIEQLFADETGQYLMLSTVHKFKGLEAPRVFVLNPELIGARGMTQEERNVLYVAVTRARKELYFIHA